MEQHSREKEGEGGRERREREEGKEKRDTRQGSSSSSKTNYNTIGTSILVFSVVCSGALV